MQQVEHRREQFGLDPDQPDIRLQPARRRTHAGGKAAAADRDHQRIQFGHRRHHFQRHSALPRCHQRIVEGVDESQVQLAFHAAGIGIGLVKGLALQHHLAADAFGLHHLHGRRGLGHDYGDRHPQPGAMVRQALRMIAGAGRDHAARALFIAQLEQGVKRPTLLIGGCKLQVFELQPDFRAGDRAQRARMHHRRFHHRALNPHGGCLDIGECQGGGLGGCGHDTGALTESRGQVKPLSPRARVIVKCPIAA